MERRAADMLQNRRPAWLGTASDVHSTYLTKQANSGTLIWEEAESWRAFFLFFFLVI